jgi:hypothetical protein
VTKERIEKLSPFDGGRLGWGDISTVVLAQASIQSSVPPLARRLREG